jgi:hypothetical protein
MLPKDFRLTNIALLAFLLWMPESARAQANPNRGRAFALGFNMGFASAQRLGEGDVSSDCGLSGSFRFVRDAIGAAADQAFSLRKAGVNLSTQQLFLWSGISGTTY